MATCRASCTLVNQQTASVSILGHLLLEETDGIVSVRGKIHNLHPGKHGITVCIAGDLSHGATSCGPIFNPFGKTHGAPADEQRMVGDLGNILADESGTAHVDIRDQRISLTGPHSVLGRSIVVYAGEDDQGRGGHENSSTTGNAGPRVAAGVIGIQV